VTKSVISIAQPLKVMRLLSGYCMQILEVRSPCGDVSVKVEALKRSPQSSIMSDL